MILVVVDDMAKWIGQLKTLEYKLLTVQFTTELGIRTFPWCRAFRDSFWQVKGVGNKRYRYTCRSLILGPGA
jgi:hypothetical protein